LFREFAQASGTLPVGNAIRNDTVYTVGSENTGTTKGYLYNTNVNGTAGARVLLDPSSNPNDLVIGANGDVYFTDGQYLNNPAVQNTIGVYRVAAGTTTVQAIDTGFPRANGIVLSPDYRKLYVGLGPIAADNMVANCSARGIRAYTVASDGTVASGSRTEFLTAANLTDVPDGIAVDSAGNLWVAEAKCGSVDGERADGGRVEVFSPTGEKIGDIPFATGRPTGVAFGGADAKTLFITLERGISTVRSSCPGLP